MKTLIRIITAMVVLLCATPSKAQFSIEKRKHLKGYHFSSKEFRFFSKKERSTASIQTVAQPITEQTFIETPKEIRRTSESPSLELSGLSNIDQSSRTAIAVKPIKRVKTAFQSIQKKLPFFTPIGAGLQKLENSRFFSPRPGGGDATPAILSLVFMLGMFGAWAAAIAAGNAGLALLGLACLVASLLFAIRGSQEKLKGLAIAVMVIDIIQLIGFVIGFMAAIAAV